MKAKQTCPICHKVVEEDVSRMCRDAEAWIIDMIRRQHPDWVQEDGSCARCLEQYRKMGPSQCP